MKLTRFRIMNYRSVDDSGEIAVGQLTSLIGRNEAGKSNLLLALQALNPVDDFVDLSSVKNFPRHKRLSECQEDTPVVSTMWELNRSEQEKLAEIFPRAAGQTEVEIGRWYKATRTVGFSGLKSIAFSIEDMTTRLQQIRSIAEGYLVMLDAGSQAPVQNALEKLEKTLSHGENPITWASHTAPAIADFRRAITVFSTSLLDEEHGLLSELEDIAVHIINDEYAHTMARRWIVSLLPVFIYVDEYPELTGHQNITEYLARKSANQATLSDLNFEKMCKVADLDPDELHRLQLANDHETRNQLANRASAIVTSELRRLWKDRQLKVRFSLDGDDLNTFISDPNSSYDVEVNLNERSRGLKWFFSFYIGFAADTKGGGAENAILLLDEPGLYLHALSQADLLRHFAADFSNQIIYTTHSPFMVATENLDSIRTVSIGQGTGTVVSSEPNGDSKTLFPVQAALGYALAQELCIGENHVLVEAVSDFWMLSSVSSYLQLIGKNGLPEDMTITPVGGARKIPYMVSLLTSEESEMIVLLNEEKHSRNVRDQLITTKLIRADNIAFFSDAFADHEKPIEADAEDLLDANIYEVLVNECYSKELKGKKLKLDTGITRIVKRYEAAFKEFDISFHKARPARLLLNKMSKDAPKMIPQATADRFEAMFHKIAKLHAANEKRSSPLLRA